MKQLGDKMELPCTHCAEKHEFVLVERDANSLQFLAEAECEVTGKKTQRKFRFGT